MTPKTFLENFGHMAGTPGAVKRLRELILQLAVQGKLVPQDPNDEPASELLKKIMEEKARLVREGKIRVPKPLPPIKPEEVPFEVPEGWEWVLLGNMGELINGDRSKNYPNRNEYVDSGVPWINTGHIDPDGSLNMGRMNFITWEKFDSLRSGKIYPGDLVYCLRGTIGKTAMVDPLKEGAIASSLMIIRPYRPYVQRFLYQYLTSSLGRSQIFRFDNGSAQPNLSANSVRSYFFPLPPFEEQRRIVERVDQLMALCDRLEERETEVSTTHQALTRSALHALTTADGPHTFQTAWCRIRDHFDPLFITPESVKALRQTILQLAVQGKLVPQDPSDEPASVLLKKIAVEKARLVREGKIRKSEPLPPIKPEEVPFEVPKGWELVRYETLFYLISPGKNKVKTSIINDTGAVPVIDQGQTFISGYIDDPDLAISIPGPVIVFGDHTCNIKYVDFDFVAGADGIKILRPLSLDERFFYMLTRSISIENRGYGRHYSRLLSNLATIPPLAEQRRIVSRVDQLMALCDRLEGQLRQAQTEGAQLMEAAVHHLSAA
ncbi:MAG: restriction endonuclease subunit S [Magnetococcales bacterium]|nr:restriction endonuclease subunit S [Magnetococcales bacterium]